MSVTFGVSKSAVYGTLIEAVNPWKDPKINLPWLAIVVFILTIVIISVFCVYRYMAKKSQNQSTQIPTDDIEQDDQMARPSNARKSTINNDDSD